MSSPDTRATALAATVNVVTWTQISKWITGRGWPGGAAAVVAMLAAESAGSLEALPPFARAAAGVLTTPGNVALQAAGVAPLEPLVHTENCCKSCAVGGTCEDDCPDHAARTRSDTHKPKSPG